MKVTLRNNRRMSTLSYYRYLVYSKDCKACEYEGFSRSSQTCTKCKDNNKQGFKVSPLRGVRPW